VSSTDSWLTAGIVSSGQREGARKVASIALTATRTDDTGVVEGHVAVHFRNIKDPVVITVRQYHQAAFRVSPAVIALTHDSPSASVKVIALEHIAHFAVEQVTGAGGEIGVSCQEADTPREAVLNIVLHSDGGTSAESTALRKMLIVISADGNKYDVPLFVRVPSVE